MKDPYERMSGWFVECRESRAVVTAPTDHASSPGSKADPTTGASTAAPGPGSTTPGSSAPAGASGPVFLDLPDIPKRPARRSVWWRWGFPTSLVLLVVAVPVLIYAGLHVVLASNHGRPILSSKDPAEPGWEAAVEPTPTALMATLSDTGDLSSVSLLALTGPDRSSVVFIPADTQVTTDNGKQTLVAAYKTGGAPGLKAAVEKIVGVDVGDVTVADAAEWEQLVTPVGNLSLTNPDNVTVNDIRLFNRGPIQLSPAQAGIYLRSRNWAEDDTNRLLRQEVFWRAWLAKIAAKGTADAVPGETDAGIGKFIRTLASTQVDYHVLPVKVQALADAYAGVFLPITADVGPLVAQTVPFPSASPPGSRPLVRVLDGTGQLDHGVSVARALAAAGAQIDGIGNASSFSVPSTQIIITGSDHRAQAESLRKALGFGEIIERAPDAFSSDSVDITVILGADALGQSVTTGSSSAATTGDTNG